MRKYNYTRGLKKFHSRFPRVGKALTYAGYAVKAYQIASKIASIVNSEKKYFDAVGTEDPSSTIPTLTHLSNITQGSSDVSRNGDSVGLKTMQVKYQIQWHASATVNDAVRVVIVIDKDNENGTPMTTAQLMATTDLLSLRNMNFSRRFKVLHDDVYTINTTKNLIVKEYYKKFKMGKDRQGNKTVMKHITWNNNDQTEERNHIYMLCFTNVSTENLPHITYFSRLRFYDN